MPRIKSTPVHLSIRSEVERRTKWQAIRSAFQARPNPANRDHRALAAMINGLWQLTADLEAADSPEAFQAIAARAQGELWEMANRCVFKDPLAILFLTDIANYCNLSSSTLVKQVVEDELDHGWCFWRNQAHECALAFQRAMF